MSESNQSNLKAPTRKAFHFPKGVDEAAAPAKGARAAVKKGTAAPADTGVTKAAKAEKAANAVKSSAVQVAVEASTKKSAAKKAADSKTVPKKGVAGKAAVDKTKGGKAAPGKASSGKSATDKAASGKATASGATAKKPAAPKAARAIAADAKSDVLNAGAAAGEKTKREKKEKVVRDSFTMPKSDYAKIATLKQKCLDEGIHVKKSELLRAGLALLDAVPAKRLVAAIAELEAVKTGRPANS